MTSLQRTTASAAALVLAWSLAGCDRGVAEEARVQSTPVMVIRVEARDVTDRIEATGQLLAQAQAEVAAQVAGQVTVLVAEESDFLDAGELVLEIDPELRRLEVQRARANLAQAHASAGEARRELSRLEKLHRSGAVSDAMLDEARTGLSRAKSAESSAEAALGLRERALRDASVGAPFAGFLARRFVNAGEYVSPGQPLFELVAMDPVEVEFHLSEVDSSRVSVGQEVAVRVSPFPGEVFRAPVTVVSPTIDPRTRTLRVKAVIENPDGRLRPGLFARVDLGVAERKGVLLVPKEAVVQRADGSVVFRVRRSERESDGDERVVERAVVELGGHHGEAVELRGKIAAGDWIVVRGQADLIDGSPVTLRNADGSPFRESLQGAPIEAAQAAP